VPAQLGNDIGAAWRRIDNSDSQDCPTIAHRECDARLDCWSSAQVCKIETRGSEISRWWVKLVAIVVIVIIFIVVIVVIVGIVVIPVAP